MQIGYPRSFWLTAVIASLASAALFVAAVGGPACAEIATWYGARCDTGQKRHLCDPDGEEIGARTASGERFDQDGFCADYPQHSCTCAHRTHPFGTVLRVSWRGRSVVCRVNDRGPAVRTGADIDLSLSAARVLGMVAAGRARVRIEKLERFE